MQVVLNLINAKPEARAPEASKILGYMSVPSMGGYVWVGQLSYDPPLSLFNPLMFLTPLAEVTP